MAEVAQPPSLAEMNLADDLSAIANEPDANRWAFERRQGLTVWVTVSPEAAPQEAFVAQLQWSDYPGNRPPSVKFVDPVTGRLDNPKAWPKAQGFRPQSLDICANWTAEGFGLHPEWNQTDARWTSKGNVLLKVVRFLQSTLDTTYEGRFDG